MAQTLGSVAVGSIVKLNENGSPVNYIVVHQGKPSSSYDSSCDGTWLLRQDIAENRVWDSGNSNVLESSDIQSYLNGTWINRYDTDIRNAIKQVKIPYRQNGGSSGTDQTGANGLSCKVFLLSGYEVGWTTSVNQDFPVDGAKLSYFESGTGTSANNKRIATLNGSATDWWPRSPRTSSARAVWGVGYNGDYYSWYANDSRGVRPALVLPSTLFVTGDGLVSVAAPPPNALTVPIQAMQGNQLSVSWTAVDGADGYILERKANTDSDWTQVYSGANTSFEETVGTWTSVQYRVKAGVSGTYGDYTTSASVPVVSASAVVISGTDGDLGTLVNDVSYTVSSDGSTELTVVETINGTETRTYTATNGATNKIPVVDLPTGYGTISITASTNPGSGVVSVTREWTYTKAAITFPDAGSVADLTQQGKTIWAKTIAEAVRTPSIWGGNLGLALQKLAGAVLYNPSQVAKYSEVTVSLSGKNEGDIVSLPENGQMVEFYVAKLDYESALNGTGRVLLVRKNNMPGSHAWNSGANINAYASSSIDSFLNGDYKDRFPQDIQTAMGTTKFYYTPGNGNTAVTTLERAVFLLSVSEYGVADAIRNVTVNNEGTPLPIADLLLTSQTSAINPTFGKWTRSPNIAGTTDAAYTTYDGSSVYSLGTNNTSGITMQPTFTLPSTFTATYYVGTDGSVHDEQEYEEAGAFTDISGGAIPMVQIETGSYVGTGTYGESNPNTLTASGHIKAAFISRDDAPAGTSVPMINPSHTAMASPNASSANSISVTWGDKNVSFYASSAINQLNANGVTYGYLLIL